MPTSKLQQTAREIGKARAASSKAATASRKRMTAAQKAKDTATKAAKAEVIVEKLPNSSMVTIDTKSNTVTTDYSDIPVNPTKPVAYIGGKSDVTLSREVLTLLHSNKVLNDKAFIMLCLMMEYGAEFITSGNDFFEGEGALVKFALAYDLDPMKVMGVMASMDKILSLPLERLNMQMSLELAFPGE